MTLKNGLQEKGKEFSFKNTVRHTFNLVYGSLFLIDNIKNSTIMTPTRLERKGGMSGFTFYMKQV